jgi:hypothetical protein
LLLVAKSVRDDFHGRRIFVAASIYLLSSVVIFVVEPQAWGAAICFLVGAASYAMALRGLVKRSAEAHRAATRHPQ